MNSKTLINEVKHIRFLNYFSNEYIYGDEGREYIYEDQGGYAKCGDENGNGVSLDYEGNVIGHHTIR